MTNSKIPTGNIFQAEESTAAQKFDELTDEEFIFICFYCRSSVTYNSKNQDLLYPIFLYSSKITLKILKIKDGAVMLDFSFCYHGSISQLIIE